MLSAVGHICDAAQYRESTLFPFPPTVWSRRSPDENDIFWHRQVITDLRFR